VVNAAIIGLGWWGKNIVKAVQGKSTQLRFVRATIAAFDAIIQSIASGNPVRIE
jgi:hypothetical protein